MSSKSLAMPRIRAMYPNGVYVRCCQRLYFVQIEWITVTKSKKWLIWWIVFYYSDCDDETEESSMHYNARNESRLVDTTGRPVRIETNRWLFISPLALAFAFSRAIDWTMDTHTDRLHFRCIFIFVLSFGDIRRIFQN